MKSTYIVVTVAVLIGAMKSESCAQKISTLEDFGNRVEKMWEVTIPVPPNPNHPSGIIYASLKSGIAVLSVDGQSIYCYDYNGHLKWQAPGIQINSSNGGLSSSANGEYLYLNYPIHEDAFTSAVYNAAGQLLWSATYDSPFVISPSGKYLIAMFDAMDYSMPLTVLDITTGKMLWKVDTELKNSYWQAVAGQNDKIAYCSGGTLRLFELENGKLLWEKFVEYDPRAEGSEVHMSSTGNVVAYDCYLSMGDDNRLRLDPKMVTYIFNEDGNLIWNRNKPIIQGKSGGGRILGISDGGEYLAMAASIGLTLFELTNKKEIWTIFEGGLHSITKFTKAMLAFYPRISPISTKLIILKKDGNIDNQYILEQFIDFRYEQQSNLPYLKEHLVNPMPSVVKKVDGQFALSRFSMKLETTK